MMQERQASKIIKSAESANPEVIKVKNWLEDKYQIIL
jgi:hypothetical protein